MDALLPPHIEEAIQILTGGEAIDLLVLRRYLEDTQEAPQSEGEQPRSPIIARDDLRDQALQCLHGYFENQRSHEQAVTLIQERWFSEGSYCLYLRRFALGALSAAFPFQDPLLGAVFTERHTLTNLGRLSDHHIQEILSESLGEKMPIVTVRNPADGSIPPFPTLEVPREEWEQVLEDLVAAAALIVVYYDALSEGISRELSLIKSHGREDSTLILRQAAKSGNLISQTLQELEKHMSGSVASRETSSMETSDEELVRTFPQVVDLDDCSDRDPSDWPYSAAERQRLIALFVGAAEGSCPGTFSPQPPMPSSGLPDSLRSKAIESGKTLVGKARSFRREGKHTEAEDALVQALGRGFLADDPQLRACAFWEMGRVQLKGLGKPHLAVRNYQRAVDLYRRLSVTDMLLLATEEYGMACLLAGEFDLCRKLLAELKLLLRQRPGDLEEFMIYELEYSLEKALQNPSAAQKAGKKALTAYGNHRRKGGTPLSARAKMVAELYPLLSHGGSKLTADFLHSDVAMRIGSRYGNMPDLVFSCLEGNVNQEQLMEAAENLDEAWELDRLLETASSHRRGQSAKGGAQ